jgi:hypothetical protein
MISGSCSSIPLKSNSSLNARCEREHRKSIKKKSLKTYGTQVRISTGLDEFCSRVFAMPGYNCDISIKPTPLDAD